jgi:hypothetical protein
VRLFKNKKGVWLNHIRAAPLPRAILPRFILESCGSAKMSSDDDDFMTDASRIRKRFVRGPDGPDDPRFSEMKRWKISASNFIDWLPSKKTDIETYRRFLPFREQLKQNDGRLDAPVFNFAVQRMLEHGNVHEPYAMHAFQKLFSNCDVEQIGSQFGRSHARWNGATTTDADYTTKSTPVRLDDLEGIVPPDRLRGDNVRTDTWTYSWMDQLVATTDAVTDNHNEDIKYAFNGAEFKCPGNNKSKNNVDKPIFFGRHPKSDDDQFNNAKWLLQMFIQLEVHPEFEYIDFMAWKTSKEGEEYVYPSRLYRYAVDESDAEHSDTRYAALKQELDPYIAEFARMSLRLRRQKKYDEDANERANARLPYEAELNRILQEIQAIREGGHVNSFQSNEYSAKYDELSKLYEEQQQRTPDVDYRYLTPNLPRAPHAAMAIRAALYEWSSACMAYCSTNRDLPENEVWCTLEPSRSIDTREERQAINQDEEQKNVSMVMDTDKTFDVSPENNHLIGKINMTTGQVYRIDVYLDPKTGKRTQDLGYAQEPNPADEHYVYYFAERFESKPGALFRKPASTSEIQKTLYLFTAQMLREQSEPEANKSIKIQVDAGALSKSMRLWFRVPTNNSETEEGDKKFVLQVWRHVNRMACLGFKTVPYKGQGPSEEEDAVHAEMWRRLKHRKMAGIELDDRMGVLMELEAVEWRFLPLFSQDIVTALQSVENVDETMNYVALAMKEKSALVTVESSVEADDFDIVVALQYYTAQELDGYTERGSDMSTKKSLEFVTGVANAMMALGFTRLRHRDGPNVIYVGIFLKAVANLPQTLKDCIEGLFQDALKRARASDSALQQ